jgi:hypothetical protein
VTLLHGRSYLSTQPHVGIRDRRQCARHLGPLLTLALRVLTFASSPTYEIRQGPHEHERLRQLGPRLVHVFAILVVIVVIGSTVVLILDQLLEVARVVSYVSAN